jgi:hypothetical protein
MEPPEANPNPTTNQPTNSVGTAENIEPFSEETPTQQDDLAEFITFISHVSPAPILRTPHKINHTQPHQESLASPTTQRKSARLANKANLHLGKDSIQLAQRVLANKLGELSPRQIDPNAEFVRLAQHLPQPLTATKMVAIHTLVEQGNQPKSNKKSRVRPVAMEIQAA